MIKMTFENNTTSTTLKNPVVNYGGPFDTVIHSPGPTLGPQGVHDFLEVDQSFGSILNLGELPMQVYTSITTPQMFVIVASMPFKIAGYGWDDPTWMYWIGTDTGSGWPAPGHEGWVKGGTSTTLFIWGNMKVGVVPQLASDILLDVSFHDDPPPGRG